MRQSRGVPGEQACVTCFEEDCLGCEKLSPPVGVCPICNNPVSTRDSFEWVYGRPVHLECMPEREG